MEQFNLNMIPGKVAPVCHASQYDTGRKIGVYLFAGNQIYTLDGTEVVSISVRKPDGHVVTEGITNTSSNYLEIVTTEQMTACPGANLCELKIEKGADVIGSLNFILSVEADPLAGGDPSESFVYNLRIQIAEGVAEEVATQYDSANVIFDNEPTAGHGIGYAVTSEGVKNAIPTNSDFALSGLSDVNTPSPSANQILQRNGSNTAWENVTNTLNNLSNVNISSIAPNDVLIRNSGNTVWENSNYLTNTSISIAKGSTMPTGFPLPSVTRRGVVCTINFAVQLPAGTYAPTDILWEVTPKPLINSRCVVACNGYQILNVLADGTIKFNGNITLAAATYIIGQVVYLTDG